MKRVNILRNNEVIFNGFVKWEEGIIKCDDATIIYYNEDEVVIKRSTPSFGHFVFLLNENSIHSVGSEFGILKLNAHTIHININEDVIEIKYELENEKSKLVIKGV